MTSITAEPTQAPTKWRTSPDHETTGWPRGVPFIVGNEMCERFSYYGMRAILTVHLVALYQLTGAAEQVANDAATSAYHLFAGAVYAFPMLGAMLADRYWGKYRTIFWLSLAYCVGHGVLAVADLPDDPDTRLTLVFVGLGFIAVGAGGIKPCVSANVGDQFGRGNWSKVQTVYQIFYFSINFGSFFATLLIPWIRGDGTVFWRTSLAFGVPGVLMAIATFFFWLGRDKFVHIPPKPGGRLGTLDTIAGSVMFLSIGHLFVTPADWGWLIRGGISLAFLVVGVALFFYRQQLEQDDGFLAIVLYNLRAKLTGAEDDAAADLAESDSATADSSEQESPLVRSAFWSRFWGPAIRRFGIEAAEGPHAVFKVCTIFIFIPAFWAIFDQHGSTWILQARSLDTTLFGIEVQPEQISAWNPLMVMALIPIMNLVYKASSKAGLELTPLRRMVVGMLMSGASFAIAAMIETRIAEVGEGQVTVWWQVLAYLVLTASEVLVSITALEFAYTQAPKRMKSVVMGLYLLTVTLGNVFVSIMTNAKDTMAELLDREFGQAEFFWFFCFTAVFVAALMAVRAWFYQQRDFTQD